MLVKADNKTKLDHTKVSSNESHVDLTLSDIPNKDKIELDPVKKLIEAAETAVPFSTTEERKHTRELYDKKLDFHMEFLSSRPGLECILELMKKIESKKVRIDQALSVGHVNKEDIESIFRMLPIHIMTIEGILHQTEEISKKLLDVNRTSEERNKVLDTVLGRFNAAVRLFVEIDPRPATSKKLKNEVETIVSDIGKDFLNPGSLSALSDQKAREISHLGLPLEHVLRQMQVGKNTLLQYEKLQRELGRRNIRLVIDESKYFARKLSKTSMYEPIDIFEMAMSGLMTAVEKFKHKSGYKFSTYAVHWIRQAIKRGLQSDGYEVGSRATQQIRSTRKLVNQARVKFQLQFGFKPTDDGLFEFIYGKENYQKLCRILENKDKFTKLAGDKRRHGYGSVSQMSDLPRKEVKKLLSQWTAFCAANKNMCSGVREDTSNPENSNNLFDQVSRASVAAPTENEPSEIQNKVFQALGVLNSRQRMVISLRFGIPDPHCSKFFEKPEYKNPTRTYTLKEVGEILGVTRERVRQIERKTLQDLAIISRRLNLDEFI